MNLAKVQANFERRVRRFERMHATAAVSGSVDATRARDQLVAYVLIELQTALGYVARCVYLAHAVRGRKADGAKVGSSLFSSSDAALVAAAKIVKGRAKDVPGRGEPSWHSEDHFSKAVTGLSLPTSLLSAMAPYTQSTRIVACARHFYAHRNQSTLAVVRSTMQKEVGSVFTSHPSEHIFFGSRHSTSPPFLREWIDDYRLIVQSLCSAI